MKKQNELLPCPFCGAPAIFVELIKGWTVRCLTDNCMAEWRFDWYIPKKEVAKMWNTRVDDMNKS